MDKIEFEPIGIIHTPFIEQKGTPIQPGKGKDVKGTIEIFKNYIEGLADLDKFSHIILLYHLHRSTGYKLKVIPYLDDVERGLFATRAPRRPNAIGLSVVKLVKIEGNMLHIENIDMLDGTPLLDIKPYTPSFDEETDVRTGWLSDKADRQDDNKADNRFE
ncbi:MAG: tRNA (N6-threonylcarbamoyladenosine(37)-N6)-methyltransferase TrmO [Candidatus Zixiibacteriota bacterium]